MWTPRPVYEISQKGETHKKSMGVENIIKDVRDNNQIETRKQEKHFDVEIHLSRTILQRSSSQTESLFKRSVMTLFVY